MMKSLKSYMMAGILFVAILGTLLHFAYEWSGNNILVGLVTPVNESIWEHTKLIFFPTLLYGMYLNKKIGTKYPCLKSSMMLGALTGILLIIVLFYTYSGIIGFHLAFVDIAIFYISVIVSFYMVYKRTTSCTEDKYRNIIDIIGVIFIGLFIFFTFSPPDIPLFINPEAM